MDSLQRFCQNLTNQVLFVNTWHFRHLLRATYIFTRILERFFEKVENPIYFKNMSNKEIFFCLFEFYTFSSVDAGHYFMSLFDSFILEMCEILINMVVHELVFIIKTNYLDIKIQFPSSSCP